MDHIGKAPQPQAAYHRRRDFGNRFSRVTRNKRGTKDSIASRCDDQPHEPVRFAVENRAIELAQIFLIDADLDPAMASRTLGKPDVGHLRIGERAPRHDQS